MTIWVIFVVAFVGGPVLFRLLTRGEPANLQWLGAFAAGSALAGLVLRFGTGASWGQEFSLTLATLGLIWLAWVGVIAFVAQAVRRAQPGRDVRRWSGVIGAIATTVPWFGLASANLFAG